MIRIQFENVSKSYRLMHVGGMKNFIFDLLRGRSFYKGTSFKALENISFEVKDKEVVGIIGRNGAGKSTTMGLIAGVLSPSSGDVKVNGRVAPLLELGAGFHTDLTGRENIVLNGLLLGMTKKAVVTKMDTIIEYAELEEFIDQPIRMYSSGMLARLGFAIAVQTEPDILLIDEVLSVGDQSFQIKCEKTINEFKQQGVTIVFVSHDASSVKSLCDKVIWIENHKIKMLGNVDDVLEKYNGVD